MELTNTYLHPDDTPEQRHARVSELIRPYILKMCTHPEQFANAVAYKKQLPDGREYLESYDGTKKYKIPEDLPTEKGKMLMVLRFEPFKE